MQTNFIIYSIFILSLFLIFSFINGNFLKFIFNFFINISIGICFILISNHFLENIGLNIGLNYFTSIFVGILGIPGLICLYILRIIL